MKRKLAVALAAVLLLAGCSSISSGYVTKKEYEPYNTYSTMLCAAFKKYGFSVYIPMLHYVPEHWRLDLKNHDQTGWVYVDEQTFNAVQVGDVYNDK
jgi:uncharacterized protein YceK